MNLLERYDRYIERIAKSGSRVSGIWTIYIVVLPFFVPIPFIPAIFNTIGWVGPFALLSKTLVIALLIIGLLISGSRFVHYSKHRNLK